MPVGSQGSFVPAASLTVVVPAGPGSSLPLPAVDGSNVSMMIQNNGGYLQLNWGAPAATAANGLSMQAGASLILAGSGPWSTATTVAAAQNLPGTVVFTRGTASQSITF